MKKILALILTILIIFGSSASAFALGTEGIVYAVSGGSASVTGYNGKQKEVEIDSEYQGYPVVAIADGAFENTFVSAVTVPDTVTSIGAKAFSGCSRLNYVRVEKSVTSIGKNAFACGNPSFVLRCDKGSYAEAYAQDYGINANYVLKSPTLKAQARTNNQVYLWWNEVTGAEEYLIYRVLSNGSRAYTDSTSDTKYDVKNLSGNTEYTFFIRAVNDDKTASSDYTDASSATVTTLCDNPEITVKNSSNRIELYWQNIKGAKKYNIYAVNGNKKGKLLKSTKRNEFIYSNLPVGKTYSFFVSIVDPAGHESKFSPEQVITTSTICKQPETWAQGSWISIDVKWKAVEGAEYYGVFYSSSNSGGYQLAEYVYPEGKDSFEYTIGGKLNYMKDYKVLIRAYNENEDGSAFDNNSGIKCRLKGFYVIGAALIALALGATAVIILIIVKRKKEYYEVEC